MSEHSLSRAAVKIERMFDAPVELVWQMWTDPEHLTAWYGPDGATVTVAKMDVRVGGTRLIAMDVQTPNGPMRMWLTGEYRDVVEHRRLVYTDARADEHGNVLTPDELGIPDHPTITEVAVEFEEHGNRTRMIMTHTGVPADSPGAAAWNTAFDKLSGHIAAGNKI